MPAGAAAGNTAAEIAVVPLATMVEELRGLADQLAELARRNEGLALEVGTLRERQAGQETVLAAKDETIVMQREALATQAKTITELRRRAEAAEAEMLRQRNNQGAPQASQDGAGSPETPIVVQGATPGVWGRLRCWWQNNGG